MRFSLEIIDRIRKACPDVEVVAKMNGTDCHDGEASMAWLGSAASLLEQHGVSLITVNGGGVMSRLTGMSADGNWEEGWKVPYAEVVKNSVSIPVAALGVLHPSICATAMSASSIGVLMHSLRLKDSDKKERRFPWKKKS